MYVFNIFDGWVKSSASIIISLIINDKGSIYLVQLHLTTFYASQNHVRGIESYRLSAPCCPPGSVDLFVVRQASWRGIITSCYPTSAGVWVSGSLPLGHSCPAFLCTAGALCKRSSQSSSEVELRCLPRGLAFKGTLIEVHMPWGHEHGNENSPVQSYFP